MTKMPKLSYLALFVLMSSSIGMITVPSVSASQDDNAVQNSSGNVTIRLNDQYVLTYDQSVRLNDVLTQANEVLGYSSVYWPEARLGIVGDSDFESFRAQVMADLREEVAERSELSLLQAQLDDLSFMAQPFQQIDLASARQDIRFNPLLKNGEYTLTLPGRLDSIYVFGAVETASRIAFQTGTPISSYLSALDGRGQIKEFANKDFAYLIRNGEVKKIQWSLYNADGVEAQPGDIIWLGFDKQFLPWALPSNKTDRALNENIANLLSNLRELPELEFLALDVETPSQYHWSRFEHSVSRNNYGGAGLLQTPTARMLEEGAVSVSFSDMEEYRRYSVSMQVLSWIEATAFYVRIPNRLYSSVPGFSGDNIYTDKGFDIKARLWQERYWIPEVSVGLRDFAGTGLFDGEYVVANKRFGAFDVSLGVGFGRLGTRDNLKNPFCEVVDNFCERPDGFTRGGGQFEYDQWFRGPAALFGGVQWQTPYEPLTVKLEYDGNDFSEDEAGIPIEPSSPWNVGFNYKAFDWLDLQASYERGDTFTFNITLHTNFNRLGQYRVQPRRVEPRAQPAVASINEVEWESVSTRLFDDLSMSAVRYSGNEEKITVDMAPYRYRDPDERIDRSARILADELPDSVREYEFVQNIFGSPAVSTTVEADAFKARIRHEDIGKSPDDTEDLFVRSLPKPALNVLEEDTLYKHEWSPHYRGFGLNPFFNQDFGSPEDFHIYQLGVYAFGRYWFGTNFEVFGQAGFNITNNYDKFNYLDDVQGGLPPVRTNVRNYVQNDVWLDRLQATYYNKLSDNVYGMAYGGYLERMYMGVGAEVLYRRVDSNWAIGFDINRVKQRDYGGWLGSDAYEATTGFVSLYYQMPWLEDSLIQFDVGQFLAEDRGVNVTFQKRFDSGVTVGAYAAFTNVSQEDYGEGSFTKGFFMSIPFDLIGVNPTRQRVGMHWMPLARNGGRKLLRRSELWSFTDDLGPFYNR